MNEASPAATLSMWRIRAAGPTGIRSRMNACHESAIDPPFSLRREDVGDVAVVVVEGEVDMVTAPAVRAELQSIPLGTSVVIDLCDTRFMDSTGLRVLFAARRDLDGRVHIACLPRGPVARLFEVVQGASDVLKLFATRGEALAAF